MRLPFPNGEDRFFDAYGALDESKRFKITVTTAKQRVCRNHPGATAEQALRIFRQYRDNPRYSVEIVEI
jgi:hypothetical protein